MSTEHRVQDGGPLERTHMKGMAQKNALENAALMKTSRSLESQKRAFVRQSTRDEEEMKHLLHRLHVQQQSVYCEEDLLDDSGIIEDRCMESPPTVVAPKSRFDSEYVSNPYPVTIVPKFGGSRRNLEPASKSRIGTSQFRRKSVEYEDIQESLTSLALSEVCSADNVTSGSASSFPRDSIAIGDWLAKPDAISSVRRLRKSITDQMHKKLNRKSSTDSQQSIDSTTECTCSSRQAASRSSSLRERPLMDPDHAPSPPSPRKINPAKRTVSLREITPDNKPKAIAKVFVRSQSVLIKGNPQDSGTKAAVKTRPRSEKNALLRDSSNKTSRKDLKEKNTPPGLSPKSSTDWNDDAAVTTRKNRHLSSGSKHSDWSDDVFN